MIGVTPYLKKEWSKDPDLRHWLRQRPLQEDERCECGDDANLFELWDHDSCARGRIDTTVCINCNKVKSFKIVR
jgi:hypothetical protein